LLLVLLLLLLAALVYLSASGQAVANPSLRVLSLFFKANLRGVVFQFLVGRVVLLFSERLESSESNLSKIVRAESRVQVRSSGFVRGAAQARPAYEWLWCSVASVDV
jgi:hypothetical protein